MTNRYLTLAVDMTNKDIEHLLPISKRSITLSSSLSEKLD